MRRVQPAPTVEQFAAQTRAHQLKAIELRRQGLLNSEIAERMGFEAQSIANLLYRAKRDGMDVPPSPWFKNAA